MLSRLMLVTQQELMRPPFEKALEAALCGGAKLIQLREKNSDRVLERTHSAAALCQKFGAQLQLNIGEQSLDFARALHAGVHLPQREDLKKARRVLGDHAVIGQSVHSVQAAQTAQKAGANYLVFGSVFPTNSHPGEVPAGLEALRQTTQCVSIPVFAIGGIDTQNAQSCLEAGAYGVAVMRSAWSANNVQDAVEELQKRLLPHM